MRALASLVLLMLLSSVASAASLTPERGDVFVNAGQGFKPVTGAVQVLPGQRVMIRKGGSALISYGGDCTARVGSGAVWTVPQQAPCGTERKFVDFTQNRMNQGVGPAESPFLCFEPTVGWVICSVFAGAVGYLVYEATQDDSGSGSGGSAPASP